MSVKRLGLIRQRKQNADALAMAKYNIQQKNKHLQHLRGMAYANVYYQYGGGGDDNCTGALCGKFFDARGTKRTDQAKKDAHRMIESGTIQKDIENYGIERDRLAGVEKTLLAEYQAEERAISTRLEQETINRAKAEAKLAESKIHPAGGTTHSPSQRHPSGVNPRYAPRPRR